MRKDSWIRLQGNKRYPATAQSLANLLRGELEVSSLVEEPAVRRFLDAIGVSCLDLMKELYAENDEDRSRVDNSFVDMLAAAKGNEILLNQARDYIEDLKDDDDLPEILAKRREQRKIVKRNHQLGRSVEDMVKECLISEGFTVRRKPIGSDFEIEYDLVEEDKEMGIEIARSGRSWLVEVKATRDPNQGVRMTTTQAETAVGKGHGFLLCVVPVDGDAEPELNPVRANMRFVRNIGNRHQTTIPRFQTTTGQDNCG